MGVSFYYSSPNKKYSFRDTDTDQTQTQTEAGEHNKEIIGTAISTFGKTYNWNETGYITPDGSRLDFSGKKDGALGGSREMDHREIAEVFGEESDLSGTEAMIQFMGMGNIRISPESNGINLNVKPTQAQEQALDAFISKKRGEVTIDFDDKAGSTQHSIEYPRGTYSKTIIADIADYFENGKPKAQSEIARFRDENRFSFSLKSDIIHNRDNVETADAKTLADEALSDIGSRYNRRAFEGEVADILTYLNETDDPDTDMLSATAYSDNSLGAMAERIHCRRRSGGEDRGEAAERDCQRTAGAVQGRVLRST